MEATNEAKNGVRFSWNALPQNRNEAAQLVIQPGALYQPLKQIQDNIVVPYPPVACQHCKFILSPYWSVKFCLKTVNCF